MKRRRLDRMGNYSKKKHILEVSCYKSILPEIYKEYPSNSYWFCFKKRSELNKNNYKSERVFIEFLNQTYERKRKKKNYRFHRNYPLLGKYFGDFVYKDIVIEIDGSSHYGKENYDKRRDYILTQCGYKILRLKDKNVNHWEKQIDRFIYENKLEKVFPLKKRHFKENQPKKPKVLKKKHKKFCKSGKVNIKYLVQEGLLVI